MSVEKSKRVKKLIILAIFATVGLLIIIPIISQILPVFLDLFKKGGKTAVEKYLRSFGVKGIFIIVILQIFQVLSLVIPAPTIWVIAGVTYGIFGGMVICIAGVVIGNTIAFFIGRKYGNKLISIIFDERKLKKLSFLENSKHPSIIQFLLYVIPGLPNNIIPYVYARTNISAKRFIAVIAVASIPSILSCTFVGHNILFGNMIIVIFIIIGLAILFVIMLKNKREIMSWIENFSEHRTSSKKYPQNL